MANLNVNFGGYSSQGIKFENQDAFAAWQGEGQQLRDKGAVVAIADGVSACTKAKEAATTVVNNFIFDYIQTPPSWSVSRSVGKILTSLNRWCHGQFDYAVGGSSQMLTTFSSLVFKSTTGFLMHVGDTRVHRFQHGQLELLTNDHTAKQRANFVLTRAIGLDAKLDVDFTSFALQPGELYVLTSDGVHSFLSNKQLKTLLADSQDLEATAHKIVQAALDAGSDDNVSCLLARVESLPAVDVHELSAHGDHLVIPPALEVGQKLEGYRVLEQVFNGTRSSLYKVLDEQSGTVYGLKTPTEKFEDDTTFLRGFLREEWVGKSLDSPHIMKVLPRRENTQFYYHVCEYIEGQSLRQWIIDNPSPSLDSVRRIVKQIIVALRTFQRNDMVHRDIKPENVMITTHGEVKLIDFGTVLVKSLLETGEQTHEDYPVGSVNYIAPEFLIQNHSDFRTDMFSLGVIVYEMLSGALPYKPFKYKDYIPESANEFHYQSIKQYRPDLPAWIDICLKKATQPEQQKRFNALSEFEAALDNPKDIVATEKRPPLIERNPVLLWQWVSAILLVIVLLQTWLLSR